MATKKFHSQFAEIPMALLRGKERDKVSLARIRSCPSCTDYTVPDQGVVECRRNFAVYLPFCPDVHREKLGAVYPGHAVGGCSEDEHEEEEEGDRGTAGCLLLVSALEYTS
jgi:hypothetical protein